MFTINLTEKDKKFYKQLFYLGIPVALQNFLNTSLYMIDTLMVGGLGEKEVAAVGLANKLFFVAFLILFGVVSGSSILSAQYWGSKDIVNLKKVLGLTLILSVGVTSVFTLLGVLFPSNIMRIFTPNSDTIKMGAEYLRIVALTYPIMAISYTYAFTLRSVGKVKMVTILSVISVGINTILNYVLIYGKFGFPALGLEGSAYATLIARIIECAGILIGVYYKKMIIAGGFHELFGISKIFFKKYMTTTFPVILNECLWGIGVTIYSVVYGRMGDSVVAIITITQVIEQVTVATFIGLGSATGVILGNQLGANELEEAKIQAKKIFKITVITSLILGIILMILNYSVMEYLPFSEYVVENIKNCVVVFILYLPFKMLNFIIMVGILRCGGDTTYALLVDVIGVWCIGVPLAFIGGLFLKYPIQIVYAMVLFEEFVKFILSYKRYLSNKWVKNVVLGENNK